MHLGLAHFTMPTISSGTWRTFFSITSKSFMMLILASGATSATLLISASSKNLSATFMMAFLPSSLLSRFVPNVIWLAQSLRPRILITLKSWLAGIWSSTVPFFMALTFNSFPPFSILLIFLIPIIIYNPIGRQ